VAMTLRGVSAAMRVRISDRARLDNLIEFLQATECRVRKIDPATLDVSMPCAPSEEQAEREVEIYLRTWTAMNPGYTPASSKARKSLRLRAAAAVPQSFPAPGVLIGPAYYGTLL
jgi:hypothetical protein